VPLLDRLPVLLVLRQWARCLLPFLESGPKGHRSRIVHWRLMKRRDVVPDRPVRVELREQVRPVPNPDLGTAMGNDARSHTRLHRVGLADHLLEHGLGSQDLVKHGCPQPSQLKADPHQLQGGDGSDEQLRQDAEVGLAVTFDDLPVLGRVVTFQERPGMPDHQAEVDSRAVQRGECLVVPGGKTHPPGDQHVELEKARWLRLVSVAIQPRHPFMIPRSREAD